MSREQRLTFNVRRASQTDCAIAAALHSKELPGEFLSLLGIQFLTVLYRGINAHPNGFVLVAELKGTVIGFVSGATNSAEVSGAVIRRHWLALALSSGFKVLTQPRLLTNVLAAGRHSKDQYAHQAELLAIAVSSPVRNTGVGKQLLLTFQREMCSRSVKFFHLIVDERNTSAHAFYERNGLKLIERVSLFNTWKYRLGCTLP